MDDLISRADVEQTVEDNILCYTHSDRPIDQDPDTECHMAIRTAFRMLRKDLRKLPSSQPEQRWIPVSERLPDNDESVLISNSHGVTKAWWNGRFWTSIAVKKYKTVTAWMPLPEPYKKGEQNEI